MFMWLILLLVTVLGVTHYKKRELHNNNIIII